MCNTTRFMGYDKDRYGDLIINQQQAQIVRKIFNLYLSGVGAFKIAAMLNKEGIPSITGTKWSEGTMRGMLVNEKYKGDAILKKSYTVDFLTKKRVRNEGQIQQYHIEEDHEAIIDLLFGKQFNLRNLEEKVIYWTIQLTLIHANQKLIHLPEKYSAGPAIRFLPEKGGRTETNIKKYGNVKKGIE